MTSEDMFTSSMDDSKEIIFNGLSFDLSAEGVYRNTHFLIFPWKKNIYMLLKLLLQDLAPNKPECRY